MYFDEISICMKHFKCPDSPSSSGGVKFLYLYLYLYLYLSICIVFLYCISILYFKYSDRPWSSGGVQFLYMYLYLYFSINIVFLYCISNVLTVPRPQEVWNSSNKFPPPCTYIPHMWPCSETNTPLHSNLGFWKVWPECTPEPP